MRIAIIPARGGSKRIPRKNVRPFAGKPMIAHAIEAALACRAIDRVVVSTDDDEIAEIARAHGAELPFRRPAELADDVTPTVPVIAHAIEACRSLGWEISHACCIYPSVPFLRARDLEEGLSLLEGSGGEGYVFPVVRFSSPIQRALRRAEDGGVAPFNPEHAVTRTQDLEPAYYDSGQFYWGRAAAWRQQLDVHGNARAIVLPEWRAVDIDIEEDWIRAELMYRALGPVEDS